MNSYSISIVVLSVVKYTLFDFICYTKHLDYVNVHNTLPFFKATS